MTTNEQSPAWFPEPEERDDSYAYRGESTPSWLARSTVDLAKDYRAFLNKNLLGLPEKCQTKLYRKLKADRHHHNTLLELVVGRMLQVLGASVTCEPKNPVDGTEIDFMAQFPDGTVGVEATSPLFDKEMGETAKNYQPLINTVEKLTPQGWAIGIEALPDLGPTDSKKQFKTAVRDMLDVPPPVEGASERQVGRVLPEGEVQLTLLPKSSFGIPETVKLAWEAPLTTISDSKRVIREAVSGKRRQARNVANPVLVAVDAKGITSSLEDFDMALFGHYVAHMDPSGNQYATSFQADGLFAKGEGEPTIAGVLAFLEFGVLRCPEPVLYVHPRFSDHLPEALVLYSPFSVRADFGG